jgi:hypothetical protein
MRDITVPFLNGGVVHINLVQDPVPIYQDAMADVSSVEKRCWLDGPAKIWVGKYIFWVRLNSCSSTHFAMGQRYNLAVFKADFLQFCHEAEYFFKS